MYIEVLSFKPAIGQRTRGYVLLICNGLELNLRIRQYKEERVYVEMPKVLIGSQEVFPVRIPKEDNRYFQQTIIEQIHQKYPGALTIANAVNVDK